MSLSVLLPMVVLGVSGVVYLTYLMGFSKEAELTKAAASTAWLREFTEDSVRSVDVSQCGRAALIDAASGPGIVWVMGQDTTARPLNDVHTEQTNVGLTLYLHDFTAPRIRLKLTSEEATNWRARLESVS